MRTADATAFYAPNFSTLRAIQPGAPPIAGLSRPGLSWIFE